MTSSLSPVSQRRLAAFALISIVLLLALFLWPRGGAAQEPVLPSVTPESLPGLELYAARCANCHGETGQGDGALIQETGATAPMPFDAAYIRAAMPSVMFQQITNGEAAVGMPPFGPASSNPIEEAGRWNLVAAVYSLATPPEDVAAGETIYAAQCAACHGAAGLGDGPDAATTDPVAGPLNDVTYWFNRSNETVYGELTSDEISAHSFQLEETELRQVIDFARTFSYAYADPAALNEPIPAGVITGALSNGTSGEILAETEVSLRAFTPEFEQTLTLTTTTDAEGAFRFDVTDAPPDWIYIAGATFGDLNFSSGANQLSRNEPTLEMPITVYDKTSDSSGVNIAQLHIVFEFTEERVGVNQLYIIGNNANAVYVGPTGDPAQGVIEVAVPEGAESLAFSRSFGSMDSFLPATDFVQTARGWADPLPLRPGDGALTLLVTYELPYSDGMRIAHPIFYETATSTIILSDVGVEVTNAPWVAQPPQTFGQGQTFLNYVGPGVPAGETITIELAGRPSIVTGAAGAAVVNRDQTAELLIGGGALLLAAVGGIFLWRYWQGRHIADEAEWEDEAEAAVVGSVTKDELLRAIADLDNAYEAGGMDETTYKEQREQMKGRLAALWSAER